LDRSVGPSHVRRGEHHAVGVAFDRAGKRLLDLVLPDDESRLRDLVVGLKDHGRGLFVDQPATGGALQVAAAYAESVLVGRLPGPAMWWIADLHPGEVKTDARDAAIITSAARMPLALRSLQLIDARVAEISTLSGFDDLPQQVTATGRPDLRPADPDPPVLERVIGRYLHYLCGAEPVAALSLAGFEGGCRPAGSAQSELAGRGSRGRDRIVRRVPECPWDSWPSSLSSSVPPIPSSSATACS